MKHHHDFSETGSWSSIRSKTTLPWQTQIQKRGGSLFPFSRRLYCIHRAHRSSKADRRGCPRRLAQGLHRAAEGSGLRPVCSLATNTQPPKQHANTPTAITPTQSSSILGSSVHQRAAVYSSSCRSSRLESHLQLSLWYARLRACHVEPRAQRDVRNERAHTCTKTPSFSTFPYVRPEPVLVK
jgi:hypothetical protein